MKLLKSSLLLFVVLGFSASLLNAQPRSLTYWSIGVNVGTMYYQGDLDDHGFEPWIGLREDNSKWGSPFRLLRPGFGAQAMYHFNPHMNVSLGLNYGWIGAADSLAREEGDNEFRRFRNLDFRNRIFEASAILNYEFFATDRHYRFRPNWSPYIFAGVAVFYHNPFTYLRDEEIEFYSQDPAVGDLSAYEDERIFLHDLRTEGQGSDCEECDDQYSLVQIAIPVGVGVRFKLTEKMDLRFSAGVRKTFTDHLDDVGSYYYADPEGYLEGRLDSEDPILSYIVSDRSGYRQIYNVNGNDNSGFQVQQADISRGRPINEDFGEKRGFPNQDDWYAIVGFTVSYIIDPGDRCPKFR